MKEKILNELYAQYLFDVNMMSQAWMYYLLLVPISLYIMFFMCKWGVLTAPLWLPITIVMSSVRKIFRGW